MGSAEIIELIWRQAEPSVFLSRREFIAGLEGWDVSAREIDGETVGATLVRGPEFHFVSFGAGRAFPPSLIADCLQPIIERHGFVRTRTPKEDARQRRFNVRIGFVVERDDEFYTYFRMERLNIHRAKSCLS
jgi:hypothetical protein